MENFNERHRRKQLSFSSIISLVMAIVIICVGLTVFFGKYVGLQFVENTGIDKPMLYVFGGLCILYGGFRLYRSLTQD